MVLLCVAVLTSCTAPAYDSIADQLLTDTQRQADAGLVKLENLAMTIERTQQSKNPADKKVLADATAQASYASNMDFYNSLQSSVATLQTRITANPDLSTQKVTDSVSKLADNIEEVRSLHASQNTLSAAYAQGARQIWDQQFKTLTVYELTLKSGNKTQ